jgi:hypothetical protein
MIFPEFVDASHYLAEKEKEAARKKKAIDKIAWRAEDTQRKAKGGHWK